MESKAYTAEDAWATYKKAFNRLVYGSEEPTAAEIGEQFDQRFGLWLPPECLKRAVR